MKFARLVALNHEQTRFGVVDLFTTDAADGSTPMKIPASVVDPIVWLRDVMFPGFRDAFEAAGEQFREVPAGVNPSAAFQGDRTSNADVMDGTQYTNTNATDGNGTPIEA